MTDNTSPLTRYNSTLEVACPFGMIFFGTQVSILKITCLETEQWTTLNTYCLGIMIKCLFCNSHIFWLAVFFEDPSQMDQHLNSTIGSRSWFGFLTRYDLFYSTNTDFIFETENYCFLSLYVYSFPFPIPGISNVYFSLFPVQACANPDVTYLNGAIILNNSSQLSPLYGSVLYLSCPRGMEFDGIQDQVISLSCLGDGNWSSINTTCKSNPLNYCNDLLYYLDQIPNIS